MSALRERHSCLIDYGDWLDVLGVSAAQTLMWDMFIAFMAPLQNQASCYAIALLVTSLIVNPMVLVGIGWVNGWAHMGPGHSRCK